MQIDLNKFEKNNWDEFVHVRALIDLLKHVASIKFDDGTGADSFDEIQSIEFGKDANGMNSITVAGTKDGQPGTIIKTQHNSPTEFVLNDHSKQINDKLITWAQLMITGGQYDLHLQTVDGQKLTYAGTLTQMRAELTKGENENIQALNLGLSDPNTLDITLSTYEGNFKFISIPLNVQPLTINIKGTNKTVDYIDVDDVNHKITLGNSTENDLIYLTIPGMVVDYPDGE